MLIASIKGTMSNIVTKFIFRVTPADVAGALSATHVPGLSCLIT